MHQLPRMSRLLRSCQTIPQTDAAFSSLCQTSLPHPLPPVGGNFRYVQQHGAIRNRRMHPMDAFPIHTLL